MIAGLAGAAALAVCALTVPAFAAPLTWNGQFDKKPYNKLTFSYNGSRIANFTVQTVLCATDTDFQYEMLYVPSVPVSGGHFAMTYHVLKKYPNVVIKISGTITGGEASGTIHGSGVCDTQAQPFHANPGRFKPVVAPKPKPKPKGSCTMSGCLASNGMYITVTGVDRTLRSVDTPQGSYTLPADPVFTTGGVGVTITETDRLVKGPISVDPASDFQLRLGSGVLVEGLGPASNVDSGNGATYPCAQVGSGTSPEWMGTLTQGASFGPRSLCFGAPTAADRQHLVLYYTASSGGLGYSTIYAKIPLG